MGRSQETFNKKEKEKKRRKKQQDKELKKQERKANSGKGQSFEDMMAYVDEFGNITSTPPDPTKKQEINAEDIQIGTPMKVDIPMDAIRKGTVSFFNDSKGYGFIKDHETKESFFVHVNGFIDEIKEGNKVSFETEKGPKGLNAVKVTVIK